MSHVKKKKNYPQKSVCWGTHTYQHDTIHFETPYCRMLDKFKQALYEENKFGNCVLCKILSFNPVTAHTVYKAVSESQLDTVEPRYNEVLGTMKITLLYQVSHYIRVIKQRNIKSWDQQNDLVIRGFCYIWPLYNEVPLYIKCCSYHFIC